MRIPRNGRTAWTTLAAAAIGAAWSMTYARGHAAPATSTTPASTAAASPADSIPEMGETYYWLDARSQRVTTRFADGSATAERGADGDISTRVFDSSGNEIATMKVDRVARGRTRLEFAHGAEHVSTTARPDVIPTLEWANVQARTLVRDGASAQSAFEPHGRITRPQGGARDAVEETPTEITVEFDGGVAATTTRNDRDVKVGTKSRRPTFITRVSADGVFVGTIRWYQQEQILAFDFPGLTADLFTPDTLKPIGGWTFQPTMAWANVQGLAFYEFHRRVKTAGALARTVPRPRRGALALVLDTIEPTVLANDNGCDYLHWLDTTVFRPCCDQHDRCYNQDSYQCQSKSWFWPFASSWQCQECNVSVAWCFAGVAGACIEIPGACIEYQY